MLGAAPEIDYLDKNYEIEYEKRMIAEWNMNFYFDIIPTTKSTTIDGKALYGTDMADYYFNNWPLDVVAKPRRPPSGYCKERKLLFTENRRVGPSVYQAHPAVYHVANSSQLNNLTGPNFTKVSNYYTLNPRYYWNKYADKYKYYTQLEPPGGTTNANTKIMYDVSTRALSLNKLVIGFEISQGIPSAYTIQLYNGSAWNVIFTGSSSDIGTDGRLVLYWAGSVWTKTAPTSPSINTMVNTISGVWVNVTAMTSPPNISMDAKTMYMNLIEVSPRIEHDMSGYVRSYSWQNNFSEGDPVAPIGTVSSGSGSIQLDNTEKVGTGYVFEDTNPNQINLGSLAKQHTKFTCDLRLKRSGSSTWYRQFTAYAQNWKTTGHGDVVNIDLLDYSSWLQVEQAPEIVLNKVTPSAAIWRLLDAAGYSNVIIRATDAEANMTGPNEPMMEWFFASNEQTIWDVIKDVCLSHQYAVYVDENDAINICTKNYLYPDPATATATWTFREQPVGGSLENYVNLETSLSEPINKVSVKYHPHEWSAAWDPARSVKASILGVNRAASNKLYTPNNPVLLGCADYKGDITATKGTTNIEYQARLGDMFIVIDENIFDPPRWGSFSGWVLIDREIIKYEGLEFSYTPISAINTNTLNYIVVKTPGELDQIQGLAASGSSVKFTGALCNIVRGEFGTKAVAHPGRTDLTVFANSAATGWLRTMPYRNISMTRDPNTDDGYMKAISGNSLFQDDGKVHGATHTFKNSTYIIARMKIASTSITPHSIGIVKWATIGSTYGIDLGNIVSGYYAEVVSLEDTRGQYTESRLRLSKIAGGVVDVNPLVDIPVNIRKDKFFYLAVGGQTGPGGKGYITVYLNGVKRISYWTPTYTGTPNATLATRYRAHAIFDFVSSSGPRAIDSETAYLRTMGSYIAGIFDANRGQETSKYLDNLEKVELETFDNRAREIFIQDIRYDHGPVLTTQLWKAPLQTASYDSTARAWIAQESETDGSLSVSSPYSARLVVFNTSQRPVVLTRDSTNYPYVYGRVVQEYTEQQKEKIDQKSLQRLGEHKYDVSPVWTTNAETAQNMADWIISRWKTGVKTVSVESFSNHLVQLGDTVQLLCEDKGYGTSNYFVVSSVSNNWSDGLATNYTLVQLPKVGD